MIIYIYLHPDGIVRDPWRTPIIIFLVTSKTTGKGPVTFPIILVLGPKVESNVVFKVQFFCADSESGIRFALAYVAYFGGKSTSKFGLSALFEWLAVRL